MGIVYLLKTEDDDQFIYKIGITKHTAKKRIKSLQTGNGKDIIVVESFKSEFNNKIEAALHRRYISKRVRGEWFYLTSEDVKEFITNCQQLHDNFTLLKNSGNPFI